MSPVAADLQTLSDAAWAEPAGESRPADRLLEKYPDLRDVPAPQRGRVFRNKILTDLIAGIPLGIWVGAVSDLVASVAVWTVQVMAAGPLLRRRGARPAILLPYLEVTVPATVLITLTFAAVLESVSGGPRTDWYLPIFATLSLALVGTLRGWPWPVRLLLHAGWLFCAGMGARQYL